MPLLDQDLEEALRLLVMGDVVVSNTPTITAGAYVALDIVGAIQTFADVGREAGDRVVLQSIVVIDLGKQDATLKLFFFDRNPANGTYTDNIPLDIDDTDMGYCVGATQVSSTAYFDAADNSVAVVDNIGLGLSPNATDLFVVAQTTGTPTYASTSDLVFKLYFLRG